MSELLCGFTGIDFFFFPSATSLALLVCVLILRGHQCPFGSLVIEVYKECGLWGQTPLYLDSQDKKRPYGTTIQQVVKSTNAGDKQSIFKFLLAV